MPALRTSPIYTDNPGSLPAEYVIPGTLELTLQSIVARFNGAAAAATFIPTCSIYTQDGRLVSRVRTSQLFAVGDTGVVSFGPFLNRKRRAGEILQVYAGLPTAAAFAFNSAAFVASGYPTNATFTRLLPAHLTLIEVVLNCDFTSPAGVPNMIGLALYVNGALEQAHYGHTSVAGVLQTVSMVKIGTFSNWVQGDNTLSVRVRTNTASATTLLSNGACDFSVFEILL